jgi:hypothetical protein
MPFRSAEGPTDYGSDLLGPPSAYPVLCPAHMVELFQNNFPK